MSGPSLDPQPEPAAAPQPPPAGHVQIVLNTARGISVTQGADGQIIISDAADEEEQEEQASEEIPEEGEIIADASGAHYRSLGDGTYEEVKLSESEEEEVEEVEQEECETPAPPPAAKIAAKLKSKPPATDPRAASASGPKPMVIASVKDFQERVLNASEPVLVVFEQSWCGACKQYIPTLNKAAGSGGYRIARIDIAKLPELRSQWAPKLKGTPHSVPFVGGEPVKSLEKLGALSYAQLSSQLSSLAPKRPPSATQPNVSVSADADAPAQELATPPDPEQKPPKISI